MMSSEPIPSFKELVFEGEKHIYRLDGRCVPSVTTVMRPLSQALYKDVDEKILNEAANRGTAIHNAIENYILYGVKDVPECYEGYFEAFRTWYKDMNPEPLATECRVYHKSLLYAGTADLPCLIDGKRILVDHKTSATVNRMLTGVQLEAYSKAYESHGFRFDGKAILHLMPTGKYQWVFYDRNDLESWEVFGALLTVHRHIQKYRNKR
ncbi:MAG: hypothetical protein II897_03805 [Clostridia bacterium]|nr:hypothetical protein [Clostridia bacterium]